MTWPVVLCIAAVSAFGGFMLGWRQCEEKHQTAALIREGWERIRADAIANGVLDRDGKPATKAE